MVFSWCFWVPTRLALIGSVDIFLKAVHFIARARINRTFIDVYSRNLYCNLTLRNGVWRTVVLLDIDYVGTVSWQARSLSAAGCFFHRPFVKFYFKVNNFIFKSIVSFIFGLHFQFDCHASQLWYPSSSAQIKPHWPRANELHPDLRQKVN